LEDQKKQISDLTLLVQNHQTQINELINKV
jgi:hypothetical protein